jgi:hypothetical protein
VAFNNSTPKQSFTASASQTEFNFNFKIFNSSDVLVYQTPSGNSPNDANDLLTETTHYTVSNITDNGFTVTLVTGAGVNDTIIGQRNIPVDRNVDYQQGGDILSQTLDDDQDIQTYMIADQKQINQQSVRLPNTAVGISTQLPDVQPDAYLVWNSTGDALTNDNSIPDNVVTSNDNVLDSKSYATEAEDTFVNSHTAGVPTPTADYSSRHYAAKSSASASAASTSETNAATSESNAADSAAEAAASASSVNADNIVHTLESGLANGITNDVATSYSNVLIDKTSLAPSSTIPNVEAMITHLYSGTGASNPINLNVGLQDLNYATDRAYNTDDIVISRSGSDFDVYKSVKGKSANQAVNGTFDTDTDWTKGNGNWTIANGKATNDGITNDFTLSQANRFIVGKTYKITFDVLDRTQGTVEPRDGLGGLGTGQVSANGTYSTTATATATTLQFYPRTGFDGSIDNVVVEELNQNQLLTDTDWWLPFIYWKPYSIKWFNGK